VLRLGKAAGCFFCERLQKILVMGLGDLRKKKKASNRWL